MKKARTDTVAVKPLCNEAVQAATRMTQIEPLQTPARKQIELVMSESTMASISCLSNSAQVSWDAFTKPLP